MHEGSHRIRRATVDFTFNGRTDAFELQQEVREWFDDFIRTFDREAGIQDELIRIDRLEAEAVVDGSDWKSQLTYTVLRQLRDKLRLLQQASKGIPSPVQTPGQPFEDVFLFFLKHGHLPWNASQVSATRWTQLIRELTAKHSTHFLRELRRHFLLKRARQRFVSNISIKDAEPVLQELILLLSDTQDLAEDLIVLIQALGGWQLMEARDAMYLMLLRVVSGEWGLNQGVGEITREVLRGENSIDQLIESFADAPLKVEALVQLRRRLIDGADIRAFTLNEAVSKQEADAANEKDGADEDLTEPIEEEGIYIDDAGLVIVAPFLPTLFERLGLFTQGQLNDPVQSTCLIRSLIGQTEIQEYDLPLAKILCGLTPETPIATHAFVLDDALKQEINDLLESVIRHWSILKNTSVEGLRESFLRRRGKLTRSGDEWVLEVEQQPYDMLLQHLPWSISLLKLPWMDQRIKTQWVY